MNLCEQLKSNVAYGRKLVGAGLQGASRGGEEFLEGELLKAFLNQSARAAVGWAAAGACVGALGARLSQERKAASKVIAFAALLGASLGFTAGVTWRTHELTASLARGALKHVHAARNERWLENNPIDYA